MRLRTIVFAAVFLSAGVAAAKQQENIVFEKHTIINFSEAGIIDGSLATPDVGYIEAQKHRRHKSLIRPRQDFRVEVLESFNPR